MPADVEEWRWNLRTQKLAKGTIYNRISALSQFYEYLRNEIGMMKLIPINPARVSLPKATKPFQSESVKALSRGELGKLLEVVAIRAQDKKPVHLRDNAILQFFVVTGKSRAEIIKSARRQHRNQRQQIFYPRQSQGRIFPEL